LCELTAARNNTLRALGSRRVKPANCAGHSEKRFREVGATKSGWAGALQQPIAISGMQRASNLIDSSFCASASFLVKAGRKLAWLADHELS